MADPEEEKQSERRRSSTSSRGLHQRNNSESSLNSAADSVVEDTPMQVQEKQETGAIGLALYKKYFTAGGGWFVITVTVLSCILSQVLASGSDYYLSYWVSSNEAPIERTYIPQTDARPRPSRSTSVANDTIAEENVIETIATQNVFEKILNFLRESGPSDRNNLDIYIFTAITILTVAVTLSRSFLFFRLAMKSSTKLHNAMFRGITRAAMYFFNTNPSGRILNRFSKDMGQVDEILPSVMMDVIQIFLSLFGIVIVVAVINPLFLVPTMVLAVIFYYLRVFYLKTSRDIKRIEGVSK